MITAIILAAGQSIRMGEPKLLLPWGKSTVLQTVVSVLQSAGVDEALVVTGAMREEVEALIGRSVQTVFNPAYAEGKMLSSIQAGLAEKQREARAALICLGDQPQVQVRSVQRILQIYHRTGASIVVPSFEKRRGHPWLVGREHWDEILAMKTPETLRDFLNRHASKIRYLEVNTPSVLADLDTPNEYLKSKP